MDRRVPAALLLAVLVTLAGCSWAQNYIRPEVHDVDSVGSTHWLTGKVTQGTEIYNETSMHDLEVLGFGPNGSLACRAALGDVAGDVEPTFTMTCDPFPLIVLVDAEDRLDPPSGEGDTYANFHWLAVRYAGYNASTGHEWTDFREVNRLGNPPGLVSEHYGSNAFEVARCELRTARANASVFGDPTWADEPPRGPATREWYRITTVVADGPQPPQAWGGLVDRSGSLSMLDLEVIRAVRKNGSERSPVREHFLEVASQLEGTPVRAVADLPAPEGAFHVTETNSREETCYRGGGTYEGELVRSYEYTVWYKDDDGATDRRTATVLVRLEYRQVWYTADPDEAVCEAEVLTEQGERHCR